MSLLPQWVARESRASAVPLAFCRILFGLCLVFDIGALIEYSPMWFDPMPFADPAPGWVDWLLGLWLVVATGLMMGAYSRVCAVLNYVACVIFLGFFAMPASCEFHPDALYLTTSFALSFLPIGRVWSIDAWRAKPADRSIGPGAEVFFALLVSSIYFESALWKLSSTMWMNGLGYWTPATQPWLGLPSLPWTLDREWLARGAGYVTLAFELTFVVLVWFRRLRWFLLTIGLVLHVGIGTILPLPLFGLIMLALLGALLPLRAPAGTRCSQPRAPSPGRRLAPAFLGLWAAIFLIGAADPLMVLSRVGFGGSHGSEHKLWYSSAATPAGRTVGGGLTWAYRLFGFRTHHIFLDDQFSRYTTQTRLRFHREDRSSDLWAAAEDGEEFFPPALNRRFKAWHYRTAYASLPLEYVEERLRRWLSYHHGRGDIDLAGGRVSIEQRPVEMPIEGWVSGQGQRNLAEPWRVVGLASSTPGGIEFEWRAPCWPELVQVVSKR